MECSKQSERCNGQGELYIVDDRTMPHTGRHLKYICQPCADLADDALTHVYLRYSEQCPRIQKHTKRYLLY